MISLLPAREKKVYVNPLSKEGKTKLMTASKPAKGGFLISLIKSLVPIVRPILTAFITKQLASMVGGAEAAQKSAERAAKDSERTSQQEDDAMASAR